MLQTQEKLSAPAQHETSQELARKIQNRAARLGVIGLGYVGLTLAAEMAKEGFEVTGIDIDRSKVDSVNSGISYVLDVPSETLMPLVTQKRIKATQSLAAIEISMP
jgi:UDP-N-acetyl-D-glucosamine dehydrogenase